jgi:hypothetical protein
LRRAVAIARAVALVGVALAGAVLLAGAAQELRPDEGIATARKAAELYAAATRGVVAFDVTTRTQIRGGPYRRDDVESVAYVVVDGKVSRKRVLRLVQGSHTANADELRRESAKPDGPLSRFGMRLPYLAEAVDAYAFDAPREESGTTTLGFRTTVRDESHGDGTMSLDAQHRPVRVVFHPAKLPAHASEAIVTVEFGTVATGRWDVTRISRAFSGRLGIVAGHVDSASAYDAYRTFPNAESANAAIERE